MKILVGRDFTEDKRQGVVHGWHYENGRYKVDLLLCHEGVDMNIRFKNKRIEDCFDHFQDEPSFDDKDVIAALAAINATLAEENYGFLRE